MAGYNMKRLELPDVTLVCIETLDHELARLAVQECVSKVNFHHVIIFTDQRHLFEPLDCGPQFVEVPCWSEKIGWSKCFWMEVAKHVNTSHSLGIQWDSWVWDTAKWTDEYLKYDYIGAPWWYEDGKNVGNGGFSLRSTRLLHHIYNNRDRYPIVIHTDDDLICRKYRPLLEEAGLTWAPERLAHDFAFECRRPGPDTRHFGFHAAFNFGEVLNTKEEMLHRARLMQQSKYISQSYMFKCFSEKYPEIIQELVITRGSYDGRIVSAGTGNGPDSGQDQSKLLHSNGGEDCIALGRAGDAVVGPSQFETERQVATKRRRRQRRRLESRAHP